MKCHSCKEDKLSEEFPYNPPSENCDHALLHCLKCLTNSIQEKKSCSQCPSKVELDSKRYKEYIETLELLFPKVQNVISTVSSHDGRSCITVTNLAGECTNTTYNPKMTIADLKNEIKSEMQISCEKQMLLYNGVELKTKDASGKILTLEDHDVISGGTIRLLVRLYEVPNELDNVIFDLSWGFPSTGIDYLDATVFLFSGAHFVEFVDYRKKTSKSDSVVTNSKLKSDLAVTHSGDVIDKANNKGHHRINVSIKSLPAEIDKLVFTLSSWQSPNISKFQNPSLRFYDKKFPNHQLCGDDADEMVHDASSQAIIMCSLSRMGCDWSVVSLKHLSNGNARNYTPLKEKILSLIP